MSELEEGFRLEMAEYIRHEKELEAKIGVIDEKLKGPEAKLEKAKALLLKAKAAYEQFLGQVKPLRSDRILLEGELELLREKKSEIRREAALARGGGAQMRPGTKQLVEDMNAIAGDPGDAKLTKATKELDAEAALAALKAKMGKG